MYLKGFSFGGFKRKEYTDINKCSGINAWLYICMKRYGILYENKKIFKDTSYTFTVQNITYV